MNLNLVIDTNQFKPFDISPALQILHDYRDAYYKYQDRLDKIAEENGQYILPDTEDNKTYKDIMSKYNTDLEAAASDFSKHMNLQNQRDLLNLFRRQRSEITPINKAIEAYNKDVDKITALGPDVTIANRNNRKISDYYGGVNPGLNYRNNKSIQSTAAGVMQGLDNALMNSPQIAGNIANQYYILKQQGIDGKDALQKILSDKPYLNTEEGVRGVSQVMDALNTVYNQFAFDEGTPENKQIWEQVVTGAIQGIQAPKYSQVTNRGYETPSDKRQMAYQEAQMAKSGYIYNPKTNKYEYDEEAHITEGGTIQTATLPDGSTWNYNPKTKQWTSPDANWDGVPRTSSQLLQERNRQIAAQQKRDQLNTKEQGEIGKRTEQQYLELGKKVAPLNYRGWDKESNWKYDSDDSGYYYGGFNSKLSDSAKEKIKPEVKMDILNRLKEQNPGLNIGWEDLDIYEDNDWFSNNHYRVVIKGTGERGVYEGTTETEAPETSSSTTRGSGSSTGNTFIDGLQ